MTITPETREELFLASASGQSVDLPTPVTREEMFLAKMAGKIENAPEPITRKEMFLKAVADNSGGGSGGDDDASIARSILDKTITEYKDDVITSIGNYAFRECAELQTIDLPNVTYAGVYAFSSCGASVINLPKLTKVASSDTAYTFSNCKNLTTLNIPELKNCSGSMLNGCSNLTNLIATKLTQVYYRSMQNTGLVKLDLPSCTVIAFESLQGSTKLTSLILRNTGSVCALHNTNAFTRTPIESGTGYIYVPAALVESYKAATNWSAFADQILAIEDYPEICGEVSA